MLWFNVFVTTIHHVYIAIEISFGSINDSNGNLKFLCTRIMNKKKKWEMKNKIVNIIRLAYVFVRSVFVAKNGWFRFFVYKNLLVTVFCIKY